MIGPTRTKTVNFAGVSLKLNRCPTESRDIEIRGKTKLTSFPKAYMISQLIKYFIT